MAEKRAARCQTKPPQADRPVIVYVLSALVCGLLAISILQFHILNGLQQDLGETQQELSLVAKHHQVTLHSIRKRRSSPGNENSTCSQCLDDIDNHLAKTNRRRRLDEEGYQQRVEKKFAELKGKFKPVERKYRSLSKKVKAISRKFNHKVRAL